MAVAGVVAVQAMTPAAARTRGLAYYLVNDDTATLDVRVRRQSALLEYLAADCMSRLGLRYTIQPTPSTQPDADLAPRDWVAKYGFGVTTRLDAQPIEEPDVNLAYMYSLGSSEREAYRSALFGGPADKPGCHEQAAKQVIAPREEAIASINPLVSELSARRSSDSRIKQAEATWAACAKAVGLPTTRQEGASVAQTILSDKLAKAKLADGTYDPVELAKTQQEERSLALALYDCDLAYNTVARPVTDEIAAAWGRDHEAELAAVREQLLAIDNDLGTLARSHGLP